MKKIYIWKISQIFIALLHFKNPLNLFISKQKATKFYLILNPIAWNSITDLAFQDLSSGGETEMLLLLPNKQRYHSDNFKKQGETQKFLSAIGCVILKLVGTSCGLGLIWSGLIKFYPIWSNLNHFEPIWTYLNQVEPSWSDLNQFGPILSYWNHLDLFWSNLNQFGQV